MVLLLKLLLTPLLIGSASLVSRRFGPAVGGVLAALPIITGSVSFFVAVEQGPPFAAQTATASLVGFSALAWFCVAYAHASARLGWLGSYLSSCLAFVAGALPAFVLVGQPAIVSLVVTVAALAIGSRLLPVPAPGAQPRPPRWDIPARMATATILVVAISGLAASLGPTLSGLLSSFPTLFGVLLVFTHHHEGRERAIGILRGFLAGLVATSLFVTIVADGVVPLGIAPTFLLAGVVCAGYQAAAMRLLHVRGASVDAELAPLEPPADTVATPVVDSGR